MTPEKTLQQSVNDYPPPPRAESPVLLIQGWYYLIIGLWAAIGLSTLQAPTNPEIGFSRMWEIRVIGLLLALIGCVMIRTSRRNKSNVQVSCVAITTALVVGILELVFIANDHLPATFLLDTGMQTGFLVWWVAVAMLGKILTRRSQASLNEMHRTT